MSTSMISRALLLCASLALGTSSALAQVKVGVINSQKALIETAELKKAQAAMEVRFKPRQEQIDKLQREIADVQNKLQTLAGKLNQQGEAELQQQGQRRQRELQRLSEDLQADVERERQDILTRSGERMQQVVQKLAEEKGLDLVVDQGTTIYFKPALEITKEATTKYDATFPVK